MNIKQLIKRGDRKEIINYLLTIMDDNPKTYKPSITLKFKALGKSYDSRKSIDNYVNFITDLSNIHRYEMFEPIMKSFIAKTQDDFSNDHKPHAIKINDNFYLSKKIGNIIKERHINKISETFNIPITKL